MSVRKWGEIEKMKRKCREIQSLHFLIFSLFPPSLSISYIKNCLILSQNVKYGTFVANVTKNLTYALWQNSSGSNSLRESSASCEGLPFRVKSAFPYKELVTMSFFQSLLRYLVRRRSLCEIRCHNFPLLTLVLHQAESIFVEKSYLGIYRIFTQTHQKFMSMNKGWF